jgi:hypothetical protein
MGSCNRRCSWMEWPMKGPRHQHHGGWFDGAFYLLGSLVGRSCDLFIHSEPAGARLKPIPDWIECFDVICPCSFDFARTISVRFDVFFE